MILLDGPTSRVRLVGSGSVTTLAGGQRGGTVDGPGESAGFGWPRGVAVASDGNLLVVDVLEHQVNLAHSAAAPVTGLLDRAEPIITRPDKVKATPGYRASPSRNGTRRWMTCSQRQRSATLRRPAAPIASARAGSSSSVRIASASATGSAGGTKSP